MIFVVSGTSSADSRFPGFLPFIVNCFVDVVLREGI